jgi:hypothetical protein
MSGGTVVPQHLWSPLGQDDWRRYVEQADFHMPVFFINANGALGVPLVNAAAGQMSLRGADQPAPLGDKTTTKILIGVRAPFFIHASFADRLCRSGRAIAPLRPRSS